MNARGVIAKVTAAGLGGRGHDVERRFFVAKSLGILRLGQAPRLNI